MKVSLRRRLQKGRASAAGALSLEPTASAKAAGLRYVSDALPVITREKRGSSFYYIDRDGKPVRDKHTLARIRKIAIPPAYVDVWICPSENGHLQATGRDARGRKQYRYHRRWREVRDETKYGRMLAFAEALPRIRARVDADLAKPGLPREKVLATVARLLETTLIRVGNEEYAKENGSFGLTTMRARHVNVDGSQLRFSFRGKSGKIHKIDTKDRRLAAIVRRCLDLPGQELFQYLDDDGNHQTIDSADVNEYLRHISGDYFTAKDFRTWVGTIECALELQARGTASAAAEAKRNIVEAVKTVAQRLGNTPNICRKCYVHPRVIEGYLADGLAFLRKQPRSAFGLRGHLHQAERAVIAFLEQRPRASSLTTQLRRSIKSSRDKTASRKPYVKAA